MKLARSDAEAFLAAEGFSHTRTKGSHNVWTKPDALRSAVIDMNCDPLPDEHIRTILLAAEKTRSDLRKFLGA